MLYLQTASGWTIFQPQTADLWTGLFSSLAVFVAFAVGGWLLYRSKKKDARLRVVLPMLCYMACLLALMSVGGHWLTTLKYPELAISPNSMMVDGEEVRKPLPNDLRLETVNAALTGEASQILLMQIPGGKTLALPDDRYPIKEIMQILR